MGDPKYRNPGGAPLSQDEWHTVLREAIARARKAEAEVVRLRRAIELSNGLLVEALAPRKDP